MMYGEYIRGRTRYEHIRYILIHAHIVLNHGVFNLDVYNFLIRVLIMNMPWLFYMIVSYTYNDAWLTLNIHRFFFLLCTYKKNANKLLLGKYTLMKNLYRYQTDTCMVDFQCIFVFHSYMRSYIIFLQNELTAEVVLFPSLNPPFFHFPFSLSLSLSLRQYGPRRK